LKVTDEALMLFHDGELDAERARAVRVGRLHHARVTARLEVLSTLGDAVRLWAAEAKVDAAAERRAFEQKQARRRVLGVGATALLAALALPFVLPAEGPQAVAAASRPPATSAPAEPEPPPGPVAVESVDFGTRPGSIFLVEGEAESETTVVWLDDANSGPTSL
jgi:hypothetical protein